MTVRRSHPVCRTCRPEGRERRRGRGPCSGPLAPRGAFTLIELLIVLAIMGIGAAIAIPRYGASIARFRAESAARRVEADLKYARAAAKAASASRTVAFNLGAASYAIGGVRELNNKSGLYTVSLTELHGVQMSAAEFGGDSAVVFDGYGRPDSGGVVRVQYGGDGWEVTLDGVGATKVARMP